MRPAIGIALELLALAALPAVWPLVPHGILGIAYLLVAQGLSTYLVHCPAHYLVGVSLGIRFRGVKLGHTTLAKALPAGIGSLVRLIPIISLSVERLSLKQVSKGRAKAMYLSGVVASCGSAFVIAGLSLFSADPEAIAATSLFAAGYLAFDLVFSPRSGDMARAAKLGR